MKSRYWQHRLANVKGKFVTVYLHHLVLTTFKGDCPDGHEGCHVDDDKSNNSDGNLVWATPKANAAMADLNGKRFHGEDRADAKLSNESVQLIRQLRKFGGLLLRELSVVFRVHEVTISNICRGKRWSHLPV